MSRPAEDETEGGLLERIWLGRIFAAEFGFSDVQANYSRVYAWMANQLGHMTLGMATALAFYWVADAMTVYFQTFSASVFPPAIGVAGLAGFAALAQGGRVGAGLAVAAAALGLAPLASTAAIPCASTTTPFAALNYLGGCVSPVLTASVVIGATILLLTLAGHKWLFTNRPKAMLLSSLFAVLMAMVLFLVTLLTHEQAAPATEGVQAAADLSVVGIYWAQAFFFAASLMLVRDRRWFLISLACYTAVFLLARWAILDLGATGDPRMAHYADFTLGICAVIASLTLWLAKEFSSDQANVAAEVAASRARRLGEGKAPEAARDDRAHARVIADYRDDAMKDSRADGSFYVAGAILAFAILTDSPFMVREGWNTASELIALITFVAIFLWVGRDWAYRAQALDKAAAPFASRLAAFEGCADLFILHADGVVAPAPADTSPLDQSLAFVMREPLFDGSTPRHMIVAGPSETGKTPFGCAMVSEAGLAPFTGREGAAAKAGLAPGETRRARFISLSRLRHPPRRMTAIEANANPAHEAHALVIDDADGGEIDPETGRRVDLEEALFPTASVVAQQVLDAGGASEHAPVVARRAIPLADPSRIFIWQIDCAEERDRCAAPDVAAFVEDLRAILNGPGGPRYDQPIALICLRDRAPG